MLLESRSGYVYERVPKSEVEELVLEEVPDIDYDSIGGLVNQIDQIRDAVELPYLHPELFKEHQLKPPKGVLLYGPPGCGKTLIAKAVANSLAKKVAAKTGQEGKSYFLNIKGPELLNKYVGETERHIRLVFQRAREKASEGTPVIVFFDEMDSLFRTRGSGVSSDVENTIVPQLLSEIDGVELLENVLVIGASNREDMIDPAILRPGRLDVKIKIERPDAESARDIFSKYLLESLPLHADDLKEFGNDRDACVAGMIRATVERMYTETEENRFLEVTYANGDKEVLYFKDFNSGAMIQNIVDRAKKMAIKDFLEQQQRGLRISHLLQACVDEFKENEDLPNTTNPDDWARISGKKGERIVFIRTLITGKQGTEPGRSIDTVANTGQYLWTSGALTPGPCVARPARRSGHDVRRRCPSALRASAATGPGEAQPWACAWRTVRGRMAILGRRHRRASITRLNAVARRPGPREPGLDERAVSRRSGLRAQCGTTFGHAVGDAQGRAGGVVGQRHRARRGCPRAVVRERLHREDLTTGSQDIAGVGQCAHGVAHVVHRVEVAHEVVAARVRRRVTDLEPDPLGPRPPRRQPWPGVPTPRGSRRRRRSRRGTPRPSGSLPTRGHSRRPRRGCRTRGARPARRPPAATPVSSELR